MKIRIIKVPYDCGYKKQRQGLGPDQFLQHNLDRMLEADGHQVEISQIESQSNFTIEVMTAFELNRLLADEVRRGIEEGFFPVVLSGNCNSCLGTIAGISPDHLGVVWFDAHGEFNTPDTTLSGFLDGMPIAMATGRCWKSVAKTIPGFSPLAEKNLVLVGARDLDAEEQRQLEQSEINLIRTVDGRETEIFRGLEAALVQLQSRVAGIYLHIDMDAFEVGEGAANHYGASGGISPEFMIKAIGVVKDYIPVRGCAIASYDPAFDSDSRFLEAGLQSIRQIVNPN
ncbi:MAG: arginase family protein [Desulfobacterales bacterium]